MTLYTALVEICKCAALYSRAAQVRCVSLAELTEALQENIAKVFFKQ